MVYDIRVVYRASYLNKVADALSKKTPEDPSLNVINYPHSKLLDIIHEELTRSTKLLGLCDKIKLGELSSDRQVPDGLLLFKSRIYLLQNSPLLVLSAYHDSTHGHTKPCNKFMGIFTEKL